jgi:hypothetical protein
MMKRKLLFGTLMLFISMVNPGCRHDKVDGMKLYQLYLKSKVRQ